MPPPKDLPGFYFDPQKNRYFPIKGPIPGSSRASTSSTEPCDPNEKYHIDKACKRKQVKSSELLHFRELHGRLLISNKCRYNFEHEYQKLQASNPMVWKYSCPTGVADNALEQLYGVVQTPIGLRGINILTVGNTSGVINLYESGNIGLYFDDVFNCMPEPIWPPIVKSKTSRYSSLGSIWMSSQTRTSFPSNISCIQRIGKHSPDPVDDGSSFQNALLATLGSGVSGGSLYILNLSEPLDFSLGAPSLHERTSKLASSDCTIWTADSNYNGTQAVIGTNLGAALINLEDGRLSWVYRTRSDIFSQQFDQSGNIVLCGLRNGAITAVDIRQKQSGYTELSARPPTRTMPTVDKRFHVPPYRHDKRSIKQNFKVKRELNPSSAVSMSSAVCSLVTLQSDDQYFLASSMDGYIKLFDRRLLQRGAVQSYEGHVNSHTHLQLGVNPSETLLMSGAPLLDLVFTKSVQGTELELQNLVAGGEDCFVRIWSIKTGELIFGENVSNAVMSTVCWPQSGKASYDYDRLHFPHTSSAGITRVDEGPYEIPHSWGVWLGSREGLFYMHGL